MRHVLKNATRRRNARLAERRWPVLLGWLVLAPVMAVSGAEIGAQGSGVPQAGASQVLALATATGVPEPSGPTAAGAFLYSLPLNLPVYKGLEPKLALRYESGSRNDEAGLGWHLTVPTVEIRTEGKGIATRASEEVPVLDGKFLRPCASLPAGKRVPGCTFLSDDPTHRPYFSEEDSGLRIAFDVDAWEGDPKNPNSGWVVVGQDGVRYDYRTARLANSDPFAYLLTTITDPVGNQVRYHYVPDTPTGEPYRYLAGITYNGVKVTLFWESRPDIVLTAQGRPSLARLRYRLRTILVEACTRPDAPGYETVRAYALTYAMSGTSGESLLKSVQELGADVVVDRQTGAVLNPTTATRKAPFAFEYQSEKDYPQPGTNPTSILPPGSVTAPAFFAPAPQMTGGSAYSDLGVGTVASLHPGLVFQGAQVNILSLPQNPWFYGEHIEHLKGDFNGDGIDDHVIATVLENQIFLQCFLGGDNAYREFACLAGGGSIATSVSGFSGSVLVADMTGDGRADLVIIGAKKYILSFNDAANRFDQLEINAPGGGWRDLQTGCARGQTLAGDINGDGLGDIVSLQDDGASYRLTVGFSDGNKREFQQADVMTPWPASPKDRVLLADVNGDGRKDVVLIGANRQAEPPPPPTLGSQRFIPVCWRRYDTKGSDPELPDSPPIKENLAPPNGAKLQICVALAEVGPVRFGLGPLGLIPFPFRMPTCFEDPNILWNEYPPPDQTPPQNETQGQWLVADVNGDGREDLLAIFAPLGGLSSRITAYVSTGGGEFRKQAVVDVPLTGGSSYFSAWSSLDIDGDHRTDLVRYVDGFGFQTIFARGVRGSLDVRFEATTAMGVVPAFPYPSVMKSCFVGWPRGGSVQTCRNDGLRSADFAADGKGNYRVVAWGFDGQGEPKNAAGAPCNDLGSSNRGCHHYDVAWRARALPLPTPNADPARWLPLDVDGDGYLDRVMVTSRGNTDLRIYTRLRDRLSGGWQSLENALPGTAAYSPLTARVGDFDGDGRADLAFLRYAPTAILLVRFDRTAQAWKAMAGEQLVSLATTPEAAAWHVADQNGDGRDDLIYAWSPTHLSAQGNDAILWRTYLSDGTGRVTELGGSVPTAFPFQAPFQRFAFPFHVVDVDNDGAADLLSVWDVISDPTNPRVDQLFLMLRSDRNGGYAASIGRAFGGGAVMHDPTRWVVVDANGDGVSDLAYVALGEKRSSSAIFLFQETQLEVLAAAGLGMSPTSSFDFGGTLERDSLPLGAYRFLDVNGDGKTDLVTYKFVENPAAQEADVQVDWEPLAHPNGAFPLRLHSGTVPAAMPFPVYANLAPLDIDRDTWTDVEQLFLEGDRIRVNGLFHKEAYNELSKVRNPFGGVTRITYRTVAEQDAAPRDECIVPPFAGRVVTAASTGARDVDAGQSPVGTQREFAYHCARWSGARREFHGFTTVVQDEKQLLSDGTTAAFPNRSAAKVTTTYDLSDACGARALRTVTEDLASSARDESSTGYLAIQTGEKPPFDCRPISIARKRSEAGSPAELLSTVTYTRDELGQIEWTEESGDATSPGDERTTHTVRTIDAQPLNKVSKGYVVTVAREELFDGTKAQAEAEPDLRRLRATYSCYDSPVDFDVPRPNATQLGKCEQSASLTHPQGLLTARLQCIDLKSGKCPSSLAADYSLGTGDAGTRVDSLAATTFAYDATGNILESVDPRGGKTTFAYADPFPRSIYPSAVTDAAGHRSLLLWDWAKGLLREDREPERQVRAVYEYDALGRMITRKTVAPGPAGDEDHLVTRFEYHLPDPPAPSQQFIKTIVDDPTADGRWTLQRLDGLGRVVRTESEASPDPESGTAVVAFQDSAYSDDSERPHIRSEIYPSGAAPKAETFIYDYLGRQTEERRPDHPTHGSVKIATQYRVEAGVVEAGTPMLQATRVTDEALHVRTTAADAYGQTTRVDEPGKTPPAVVSARYRYDAAGDLVSTAGPAGEVTTYEHDGLGRLVRQVDPDRGETLFSYDAGGDLIRTLDANKVELRLSYDALGRLTTKTDSKNNRKLSFFYDDKDPVHGAGNAGWGMLTLVRDSAATACPGQDVPAGLDPIASSYAYDLLGRPVRTEKCWAGLTETTRESYDRFGRLASVIYPDKTPEVLNFEYDAGGRVTKAANTGGTVYVSKMRYDAAGRPRGIDFGNGTKERCEYDSSWRLLEKETLQEKGVAADLHTAMYGYTSDRLIASIKVNGRLFPAHVLTYTHDAQHRLIAKQGFQDESFDYDDLGNLTSASGATYEYPAPGPGIKVHAISSAMLPAGAYTFRHDAVGNLNEIREPRGTRILTWDGNNRLQNVTFGGTDTSLAYDALGQRIEKTVAGGETRFYFSPTVEVSRRGGKDRLIKYYFAGGRLIARRDGEGVASPLRFYHQDHLGSTLVMTDETGRKVNLSEFRYRAYGALAEPNNTEEARDILYTGARHDFETAPATSGEEFVYLGARYYWPAFGRFISADPIVPHVSVLGLNRYAYASDSPISRLDPSGNDDLPESPEYEGQEVTAGEGQYIAVREDDGLAWYPYDVQVIHEQAPPPEPGQQAAQPPAPQDTGFFDSLRNFITTDQGRAFLLQAAALASMVNGDASPVAMDLYGYQIAQMKADVFIIGGVESHLGKLMGSPPLLRGLSGEVLLVVGGSPVEGPYAGVIYGDGFEIPRAGSPFSASTLWEDTWSVFGGHQHEILRVGEFSLPGLPVGVGIYQSDRGGVGGFQFFHFGDHESVFSFILGYGIASPHKGGH